MLIFILLLSITIYFVCFEYWLWAIRSPKRYMWGGKLLKVGKPEAVDLYAWKIFRVNQTESDLDDIYLSGYMQDRARYSLFGENHYRDPLIVPHHSDIWWSGLEILDEETKIVTNAGFHCFKEYFNAVAEIWIDRYVSTSVDNLKYDLFRTQFLIGKVRIWGTVVEAVSGYQAEYLEIIELYSLYPYAILSESFVENDINSTYTTYIPNTLEELTEKLGWPFEPIAHKTSNVLHKGE